MAFGLREILTAGATLGGFALGGPIGAATAAAAATAGQGGDLKSTALSAGLAGVGGVAGNAFAGKDLLNAGLAEGLFQSAPNLPNAGSSIGSFDVLGTPPVGQSPAPGFTNVPSAPPGLFSRQNIPALTNAANLGLQGAALTRRPPRPPLRVPPLPQRSPLQRIPFGQPRDRGQLSFG